MGNSSLSKVPYHIPSEKYKQIDRTFSKRNDDDDSNVKKIALVGNSRTGKTCLVKQHVENQFVHGYSPTYHEIYRKTCQVDGTTVTYQITDTGYDKVSERIFRDSYWRANQGFVFVYSVCDHASFDECTDRYQHLVRIKDVDHLPVVLVGTKSDSADGEDREVPTALGEELAKQLGIPFFETSAKDRINIDEVFEEIVRQIVRSEAKPV